MLTCLEVLVAFGILRCLRSGVGRVSRAALYSLMCVAFDVVFVVMEVSKGLLGVGFAIMVSRHLTKICCVDVVSSLTMLFVGLCVSTLEW